MSNDPQFNFDFRPETYWDVPESVLANIKGEWRRRKIAEAVAKGEVAEIPEPIFADALSEEMRAVAGRMHPHCMGGEYLPDCLEGEVEIARVALDSTTWDVISLRARMELGWIRYRVVDEYEEEGRYFVVTPECSIKPLTMGELIELMDNVTLEPESHRWDPSEKGLTDRFRDMGLEGSSAEDLEDFVRVSSTFYPDLGAYYRVRAEEWVERNREVEEEEEADLADPASRDL